MSIRQLGKHGLKLRREIQEGELAQKLHLSEHHQIQAVLKA